MENPGYSEQVPVKPGGLPVGHYAFLAEASRMLASSLDLQTTLDSLTRLAVPYLAQWCTVVTIHDSSNPKLQKVAAAHADPAKELLAHEIRRRFPMNLSRPYPALKVLATGTSQFHPDATEVLKAIATTDEHLQLLNQIGFSSVMAVPMLARGKVIGVLTFCNDWTRPAYTEADLATAEELARLASLSVDNSRLYEAEQLARRQAEQAAGRISRLLSLTETLSEALTRQEVAEVVTRQSLGALGAVAVAVVVQKAEPDQFEVLHTAGNPAINTVHEQHFPATAIPALARVMQTGQPLLINEPAAGPDDWAVYAGLSRQTGQASVALFPLLLENRPIGVISFSFGEVNPFNQADQEFMLALARQCSQSLERARLYEAEQIARAQAQAAEKRFRELVQSLDAIVWEGDRAGGRFTFVSQRAEQLLGYPLERWLNEPNFWESIIHAQDRLKAIEAVGQACREDYSLDCEYRVIAADGRIVWLREMVYVARNSTAAQGRMRGLMIDTTERREYWRNQEELNYLRDLFLSTATHELRTPLTSIKGYTQILWRNVEVQREQATPAQLKIVEKNQRGLSTILRQIERMEGLISQLLDFARLQNKQVELQYNDNLNMVELVRQVIEQQMVARNTHPITLQAPETDIRGCWDEARIEQVLNNLLSNAIKYSPPGTPITVRATLQKMAGQPAVRVAVQDQGFGIKPEDQAHIFERFYRSRTRQTSKIEGLGLGLYITNEIIRMHHGQMDLESEPGQGSTFYFTLPLTPPVQPGKENL